MLCRYPGPRESVHIMLLVSPVSFSHNNVRTVPRARPVVQAWHVIFLISGFFDSLFLADSGGEEQDDWLLG